METLLVNVSFAIYFCAMLGYGIVLFFKVDRIASFPVWIALSGALVNLAAIIVRGIASGALPIVSLYETLVFFAFTSGAALVVAELVFKHRKAGFFINLMQLLLLAFASLAGDKAMTPLVPALQSNWLTVHVASYFIGYGFLLVSFIGAVVRFIRPKEAERGTNIVTASIAFAFPFLTIGLATGAVWAKVVWGSYWSWDPKETASLVTWLIYLNYLHLPHSLPFLLGKEKTTKKTMEKILNAVAIFGFLALAFTYIGINFLKNGLHGYGR